MSLYVMMTLDLNAASSSKRAAFYSSLESSHWRKLDNTSTTWNASFIANDANVALASAKASIALAAKAASIPVGHLNIWLAASPAMPAYAVV